MWVAEDGVLICAIPGCGDSRYHSVGETVESPGCENIAWC